MDFLMPMSALTVYVNSMGKSWGQKGEYRWYNCEIEKVVNSRIMLKIMESAGPRETSFGLLTAEVPPCIPEFMTGIPHINESFPSASSITPDHFSSAGRGVVTGSGQEAEERGLQPLVELERQQARHQAPTPAGRSSGQGSGDQGVGELSPFSSVQGLHHPSSSGGDMSPINGASLPADLLGGKPGALSPPAPSSLSGKHSSSNAGVEYAWMKEKKPSRKQQHHLAGGPPPPQGHHPPSVMQHQVSAMQPHQTALNGLGKSAVYLYPNLAYITISLYSMSFFIAVLPSLFSRLAH